MSLFRSPRHWRGISIVFALLAGLMLQAPYAAYAGFSGCRADPIIWLSNGYMGRVTTTVASNANYVENITYTVRVPEGVQLVKIVYTGGALRDKEVVEFFADQPAGSYSVDTVVTTPAPPVAVEATAIVGPFSHSVKGLSNERLRMEVHGVP